MAHDLQGVKQSADATAAIAFLKARLAHSVVLQGQPVLALSETAVAFNNTRWFWTGDNAKSAELLVQPAQYDADPAFTNAILDFVLAMSPADIILCRCASPELKVLNADPTNFRIINAFHEYTGNLSRGLIQQAAISNDGRPRSPATHSGNIFEFRLHGRHYCIDVEDCIRRSGLMRAPGQVTAFHESDIEVPAGLLRRKPKLLGRLRYEYRIEDCSPILKLSVAFMAEPGISLRQIRISTALDQMDHSAAHDLLLCNKGETRRKVPLPLGTTPVSVVPVDEISLFNERQAGFDQAMHMRLLDSDRLVKLTATTRIVGQLHWLLARYGVDTLGAGQTLTIKEQRLMTTGSHQHQIETLFRLMRKDGALNGVDPSISHDHGVALNAVATMLLHASRDEYREAISAARQAELRGWYDRHLASYFAGVTVDPAVFIRGLGFVLLSLQVMLRATGDEHYRACLTLGLDLLLARQQQDSNAGNFLDTGQDSCLLDCQATAVLALANLLEPGCDERILPALRSGLAAIRYGTLDIRHADILLRLNSPLVRTVRPDGSRVEDGGFRSFKLGLLLRALSQVETRAAEGLIPFTTQERAGVRAMAGQAMAMIRQVRHRHAEGVEFRTSPAAAATNSETQPWVVLGLLAAERAGL